MTCAYCKYEFCWACGESAKPDEGHFSGNGCGVSQMDASVRPGDHLRRKSFIYKAQQFVKLLCGFLTFLVLYIPCLVFFLPFMFSVIAYESTRHNNIGINRRVVRPIVITLAFCVGMLLNICFIPAAILGTICAICALIFRCIQLLIRWCFSPPPEAS